jgi:hypothetical protein
MAMMANKPGLIVRMENRSLEITFGVTRPAPAFTLQP